MKFAGRCPKCLSLDMSYDKKEGRFHCNECGYSEYIPKIG